ncbi:hypothetical protein EON66_00400 [archaeon]|nr:MAG: hypothetical protein EON66_00400 [archaeon]
MCACLLYPPQNGDQTAGAVSLGTSALLLSLQIEILKVREVWAAREEKRAALVHVQATLQEADAAMARCKEAVEACGPRLKQMDSSNRQDTKKATLAKNALRQAQDALRRCGALPWPLRTLGCVLAHEYTARLCSLSPTPCSLYDRINRARTDVDASYANIGRARDAKAEQQQKVRCVCTPRAPCRLGARCSS